MNISPSSQLPREFQFATNHRAQPTHEPSDNVVDAVDLGGVKSGQGAPVTGQCLEGGEVKSSSHSAPIFIKCFDAGEVKSDSHSAPIPAKCLGASEVKSSGGLLTWDW